MECFKHLVAFSDDLKKGKVISEFELLYEFSPSNCTPSYNELRSKHLKGKQKQFKSSANLINEVNNCSVLSSHVQNINLEEDARHELNGTKKHIIAMRMELLENINTSYECSTTYNTLLDTLINLEESILPES